MRSKEHRMNRRGGVIKKGGGKGRKGGTEEEKVSHGIRRECVER